LSPERDKRSPAATFRGVFVAGEGSEESCGNVLRGFCRRRGIRGGLRQRFEGLFVAGEGSEESCGNVLRVICRRKGIRGGLRRRFEGYLSLERDKRRPAATF